MARADARARLRVMADATASPCSTRPSAPAASSGARAAFAACSCRKRIAAATRARLLRRYPDAVEARATGGRSAAPSTASSPCSPASRATSPTSSIDDGGMPDFNRRVYAIARKIPPGADHDLWRDRRAARRQDAGARGRPGDGREPDADHHALPSRAGGERQERRLLGRRRRGHQAASLLTIEGAQPNGPTLFDHLPLEARRR